MIPGGDPLRLDGYVGGTSRTGPRSLALFNAGGCVVGLGDRHVTSRSCWRGFVPGSTVTVDLAVGEGVFAVVAEGYVGEVDLLRVG